MKRTPAPKQKTTSQQLEALKRLPSPLFTAALYRSGAGAHTDQPSRYSKRERASHRADERRARLSAGE